MVLLCVKSDWIMYSYEPSGREIFLKIWTSGNLEVKIKIEYNTAIKHCPSMSTWLGYQVPVGQRVLPHPSELMAPGQHGNQAGSGQCDSTQPPSGMLQVRQTNSPGICSHFLVFFLFKNFCCPYNFTRQ